LRAACRLPAPADPAPDNHIVNKAIIIGATSGIGRELARLMAGGGYTVGIAGRRLELLQELQREFPGKVHITRLDVAQPVAMGPLKELIFKMGGTDVVVISSGAGALELNTGVGASLDT